MTGTGTRTVPVPGPGPGPGPETFSAPGQSCKKFWEKCFRDCINHNIKKNYTSNKLKLHYINENYSSLEHFVKQHTMLKEKFQILLKTYILFQNFLLSSWLFRSQREWNTTKHKMQQNCLSFQAKISRDSKKIPQFVMSAFSSSVPGWHYW